MTNRTIGHRRCVVFVSVWVRGFPLQCCGDKRLKLISCVSSLTTCHKIKRRRQAQIESCALIGAVTLCQSSIGNDQGELKIVVFVVMSTCITTECWCVFEISRLLRSKMKLGSCLRSRRMQFNGPTLRS